MSGNILVLGGSQFVGPAFIRLLQSKKYSVSVLNRGSKPVEGTTQLIADRNDKAAMQQHAGTHYDAVIDLSCYNAPQAQIAWETFSEDADRWVYLSTIAVYEDTPLPTEEAGIESAAYWGGYGKGKAAADAYVLGQSGPPLVILRPPYLYGPENHIDRERFVWRHALAGKPIAIPGDGTALVQFLHIEDLATALFLAMTTENLTYNVFNVAGKEQMTLKEYVTRLCAIAGTEDLGVLGSDASDFPFGDYPCSENTDRIRKELGWEQRYSFDEGFTQKFAAIRSDLT